MTHELGLNLTGLSLQGMRIGPVDPKKGVAQVGVAAEAKTVANKSHFDTTIFQKKDRTGFGGGFKIPEEHRLKKENQKRKKVDTSEVEGEEKEKDQSAVTKDEIFAHLNLGSSDTGIGSGKYG